MSVVGHFSAWKTECAPDDVEEEQKVATGKPHALPSRVLYDINKSGSYKCSDFSRHPPILHAFE